VALLLLLAGCQPGSDQGQATAPSTPSSKVERQAIANLLALYQEALVAEDSDRLQALLAPATTSGQAQTTAALRQDPTDALADPATFQEAMRTTFQQATVTALAIPPETVVIAPDQSSVTFLEVGIYARDSFDFNGDQFLGFWDVDGEVLKLINIRVSPFPVPSVSKDPRYHPNMGLVRIANSSFQCYRDILKNKGRDFIMYSDVKRFPLAGNKGFSFELQSGKPV